MPMSNRKNIAEAQPSINEVFVCRQRDNVICIAVIGRILFKHLLSEEDRRGEICMIW